MRRILVLQMTSTLHMYRKMRRPKELLAVTLLLSMFSLSGFVGHATPGLQQRVRTELVVSGHQNAGQQAVFYSSLEAAPTGIPCYHFPGRYYAIALLNCNRRILTRFSFLSRQWRFFISIDRCIPIKIIPPNSGDVVFTV